jgi:hypothetical protein
MPYPNEHAARQIEPSKYKSFRRSNLNFPRGISAIIGILSNGKTEIQSLRFDKKFWTVERAQRWLKNHNFKTTIEAATAKCIDWNGVL